MCSKLEDENIFNIWQIGYRNKRCAMEHILRLADDAQIANSRHHKGATIFIDVGKAFDSVRHNGLSEISEIVYFFHKKIHCNSHKIH